MGKGDCPSMGSEQVATGTRQVWVILMSTSRMRLGIEYPYFVKKKIWTDRLRCSGTRGGSELTLDMRTMKFISGD